jgi:hypothetical protein
VRIIACVLCFSFSAAAEALPITIDFTGTISKYTVANETGAFVNALSSLGGDLDARGSVTFDIAAGPEPAEVGPEGFVHSGYTPTDFINSTLTYALGTYTVTSFAGQTMYDRAAMIDRERGQLLALQDLATDYDNSDRLAPNTWNAINLNFVGTDLFSGPVGTGESVIPNLSDLGSTNSQFVKSFWDNGFATGFDGLFTITSARVRSVPEPATLSLFALGAFGIAWARRRRPAAFRTRCT